MTIKYCSIFLSIVIISFCTPKTLRVGYFNTSEFNRRIQTDSTIQGRFHKKFKSDFMKAGTFQKRIDSLNNVLDSIKSTQQKSDSLNIISQIMSVNKEYTDYTDSRFSQESVQNNYSNASEEIKNAAAQSMKQVSLKMNLDVIYESDSKRILYLREKIIESQLGNSAKQEVNITDSLFEYTKKLIQ
jgi:Skp family chaperone for outer membrane proteins